MNDYRRECRDYFERLNQGELSTDELLAGPPDAHAHGLPPIPERVKVSREEEDRAPLSSEQEMVA